MVLRRVLGGSLLILICSCGGGGGGGSNASSSTDFIQVTSSSPLSNTFEVSTTSALAVTFDQPVKPSSLNGNLLLKDASSNNVAGTISVAGDGLTATFTPAAALNPGENYQLQVLEGVIAQAGKPLFLDELISFQTERDFSPQFFPPDGAIAQGVNICVEVYFAKPVNPDTVTAATFYLEDPSQSVEGDPQTGVVNGAINFLLNNHVIQFCPSTNLAALNSFVVHVIGGANGVRSIDDEVLDSDQSAQFTTSSGSDLFGPDLDISVNGIADSFRNNLTVPRTTRLVMEYQNGFFGAISPGSLELKANVAIAGVAANTNLIPYLPVNLSTTQLVMYFDHNHQLPVGQITFNCSVEDSGGNRTVASPYKVTVRVPADSQLPFEETQIVAVRFDMDRNSDGEGDFEQDLKNSYGLLSVSDQSGLNATVLRTIKNAIIQEANRFINTHGFGRVKFVEGIRNVAEQTTIAVGGPDPQFDSSSNGDADGSGVLGRAVFDRLNANRRDDATGTSPAVGVFTLEMLRFGLQSTGGDSLFKQTYSSLSPLRDGIPVGESSLDPIVLAEDFDPLTASEAEEERYNLIQTAINRFATFFGVVLAHEAGHTFGLVPDEWGFGYHNQISSVIGIMSATLSFTGISLLSDSVAFDEINSSYLGQLLVIE